MNLKFTVGLGCHSGRLPEKLDKVRSGAEAAAPSNLRNVLLGSKQIVFCHLQPVADKILMQRSSGFLADQGAQVIRMVAKMGGDFLVCQGGRRIIHMDIGKNCLAYIRLATQCIPVDHIKKAKLKKGRGSFAIVYVLVQKIFHTLHQHMLGPGDVPDNGGV